MICHIPQATVTMFYWNIVFMLLTPVTYTRCGASFHFFFQQVQFWFYISGNAVFHFIVFVDF